MRLGSPAIQVAAFCDHWMMPQTPAMSWSSHDCANAQMNFHGKNEAQQVGQEFSKPSSLHCIKTFSKLKSALGYVSSICVTDDDWGQLRADVNQFNGMAAAVKEARGASK